MKYIDALRNGLRELVLKDNAFLVGEDIMDPYGGAFGVTRGLSSEFPDNVIGTPMTEQGFTAMSIGMALQGCKVIEEIMFCDFITLCCDQLINHAAKFHDMYGEELNLVIRTPSGAYRGYGATHSQSLERIYLGVPGMQVVAPSIAMNPGELLKKSVRSGVPTLFIENKLDYSRDLLSDEGDFWKIEEHAINNEQYPVQCIKAKNMTTDISIITYGGMVDIALDVARELLYEEEIVVNIIIPAKLNEIHDLYKLIDSKKVVVVEEGVSRFGWGSEVCYQLNEKGIMGVKQGMDYSFIPASKTDEEKILPSTKKLSELIRKIVL